MYRYPSSKDAREDIGLLFLIAERAFCLIGLLGSPVFVQNRLWWVMNPGEVPKQDPVVKDIYRIILFLSVGFLLPLAAWTNFFVPRIPWGLFGCWLCVAVLQDHVNARIFDRFRYERLPLPKKRDHSYLKILLNVLTWLFPMDKRRAQPKWQLTSGPRRVILAIMDFWLFLVGFALMYWGLMSTENFKPELKGFGDALYFSILTGTMFGRGEILAFGTVRFLSASQTLVSLFFLIIIVAHTVDYLREERLQ